MSSYGFQGDLLLRSGVVEAAGLSRAIEAQAANGSTLGRALAGLGLADEAVVAATIAAALHLDYLDGELPVIKEDVVALLSAEFCRKNRIVPLEVDRGSIRVAVADPLDHSVLQDVGFRTDKKVVAVVVTETWAEQVLAQLYPQPSGAVSYDRLIRVDPAGEVEEAREYEIADPETLTKDVKLPPIVRLVNLILSNAASVGASDIHVEPQENGLLVRQRIDGLLREAMTVPKHLQDQAVSRFKIISGMDIAERRKPQDGRCRLRYEGKRIDLRVSTLPTQFGEKVVIRLLRSESAVTPLDQLGFSPDNLRLLQSFLSRPQGMILVTGPTGSGKTSTLYAALNAIKSSTTNIITLEDPIEYQLPGVNQTQMNTKAGVTFASGLRSVLRQDPNVILVGEIRDHETAGIALEAAQTGHLLLSTLHTNDATATITRLFDLGVQPFLVASSLLGVIAQRLVRRLCVSCAVPRPPGDVTVATLGGWSRLPPDAQWQAGQGCERCGGSGLRGRLAIHEVLPVTEEIKGLIFNRASEQAVRTVARRAGMRTMIEDGIDKAARGLTTLEEVLTVIPPDAQFVVQTPTADPAAAEDEASSVPRRVLIVEDSPTIVSVVKYFLELEGFEVLVAEDGLQGLEIALRERPDVIVSDVQMPGMGGIEMVKAIRQDPRGAGIKVIMLTVDTTVEGETEGLAAGADDYLAKPVEPRRLAARVKAVLARRA